MEKLGSFSQALTLTFVIKNEFLILDSCTNSAKSFSIVRIERVFLQKKFFASFLFSKICLSNFSACGLKSTYSYSFKYHPYRTFLTISHLIIQLSDASCFPALCISLSHVVTTAVCRLYLSQTWLYLNRHDNTWSDMTILGQTWLYLVRHDYTWVRHDYIWSDMTIPGQTWL